MVLVQLTKKNMKPNWLASIEIKKSIKKTLAYYAEGRELL